MNMKKMMIAGMLTTLIAGGALGWAIHSDPAAAAAPEGAAKPPRPAAGPHQPRPHNQAPDQPDNQPPGPNGDCQRDDANPTGDRPPLPDSAPRPESAPQGGLGDGANPPANQQPAQQPDQQPSSLTSETTQGDYTVRISGGFDTDPQDHGRPDVLIAAALGVPTEVFREAFSGVHPAGLDRGPTAEEAQANKAALMSVLSPYGITNDRLDEVSNYYRYNGRNGGIWRHTLATAEPVIADGQLVGVTITNPGSGYSSAPIVTITGPDGTVTATASVNYTSDFATNGSLTAIELN
jgi:hypothetical protein